MAELADARPRRAPKPDAGQGRVAEVAGNLEPVRTQPLAGSNPAPATKVSLDAVAEQTVTRRKQDSSIEAAVASRTGHSVGCECFHCVQTYRFIEQQRKSTEKKEEPKKAKRR